MLMYFIVFFVVGFFVGVIIEEEKVAMMLIIALSGLWAFIFGPWAIATFIELLIGYGLAKSIKN